MMLCLSWFHSQCCDSWKTVMYWPREVEQKNRARISQLEGEAKEKEAGWRDSESLEEFQLLILDSQVKLDQLNLATGRLHESIRQLNLVTFGQFGRFGQFLIRSNRSVSKCGVWSWRCESVNLARELQDTRQVASWIDGFWWVSSNGYHLSVSTSAVSCSWPRFNWQVEKNEATERDRNFGMQDPQLSNRYK